MMSGFPYLIGFCKAWRTVSGLLTFLLHLAGGLVEYKGIVHAVYFPRVASLLHSEQIDTRDWMRNGPEKHRKNIDVDP